MLDPEENQYMYYHEDYFEFERCSKAKGWYQLWCIYPMASSYSIF